MNRELIDRVLDVPPINGNAVMMYRRLISLIEEYNRIARNKGLPTKKIPVYNNNINYTLIRQLTVSILKDIDMVKNIKREKDAKKEKILTGVTFENKTFKDGIWTYIIGEESKVSVKLNIEELANIFPGGIVTLGYDQMPYERLIDVGGSEYITNSYKEILVNTSNSKSSSYIVTSLTINDWTNRNIEVMSGMFVGGSTLTLIALNNFNTSSVTNMEGMFNNCSALTTLTLDDKFDTSSVTTMKGMFWGCSALTSLDLSNFDTSRVTTMMDMFWACSALTSLDLSNFDTSRVTTMYSMFGLCSALTSLNVSNFNTSSVTKMSGMFTSCSALTSLDLSNFDTSRVTTMHSMFGLCSALTSLTLGDKFDTSNLTAVTMHSMFIDCSALTSVKLYQISSSIVKELPSATWTITDTTSNRIGEVVVVESQTAEWSSEVPTTWTNTPWTLVRWKMATNVEFTIGTITATELSTYAAWKDDNGLWYYIQNKENISVYADKDAIIERMNGGTELVLDYEDMPYELLIDKDGNEYKVNKYAVEVTTDDAFGLFGWRGNQNDWNNNVIGKLTSLIINNWTNKNVTNMKHMFSTCSNLTTLNLNNFNTSAVTNMDLMFLNCGSLTTIDLSIFDTTAVTNMSSMFFRCSDLTTIMLGSNFSNISAQAFNDMFGGCYKITTVLLYNTSNFIIQYLPSATWTVKDNTPKDVGTVTVTQGTSATWNPSDLPAQWEDDVPWTLSRTIQSQ